MPDAPSAWHELVGIASMSGLPACGRRVLVAPPLAPSAPSCGFPASERSPGPLPNPHDPSSSKLKPFVTVATPVSQFGPPPCGKAITEPNAAIPALPTLTLAVEPELPAIV